MRWNYSMLGLELVWPATTPSMCIYVWRTHTQQLVPPPCYLLSSQLAHIPSPFPPSPPPLSPSLPPQLSSVFPFLPSSASLLPSPPFLTPPLSNSVFL